MFRTILLPSGLPTPSITCSRSRAPPHGRRSAKYTVCHSSREEAFSIAAEVAELPVAETRPRIGLTAMAIAAAAALAAAAVLLPRWQRLATAAAKRRKRKQRKLQASSLSGLIRPARGPPVEESKEFRMALARTRQAVAVNKAVGFMKTGNVARAMVEVRRALHENSVCRAPLLGDLPREDRLSLYSMHLRNTIEGQASSYATLLQLRTLLSLEFDEAEQAESEVYQADNAYSI